MQISPDNISHYGTDAASAISTSSALLLIEKCHFPDINIAANSRFAGFLATYGEVDKKRTSAARHHARREQALLAKNTTPPASDYRLISPPAAARILADILRGRPRGT